MVSNQIAYLASGKLFFRQADGKEIEHKSQFGEEMKDRAMALTQKNSWKNRKENDLLSSRQLWGVDSNDPSSMQVHITALSSCENEQEIIYALSTTVVGGLFIYDRQSKKERRLFHKEGMIISDLARDRSKNQFVCSLRNADGTAFIAKVGTSLCDQITEGDCVDEAPTFVPSEEDNIVYQSAGVGRNKDGIAVGLGPCSIQKLNIKTGDHEEILFSEKYDYLLPQMTENGDLYFVRRPYQTMDQSRSATDMIKDIVLFPYRLGKAFIAFLNFFSLTFTRQPLTTSNDAQAKGLDMQKIFLRGRMIDAQEAMKGSKLKSDEAPLVPPDWELVKRSSNGSEETIARSVVDFDFDQDKNLIYSNGRAIYKIGQESSASKPELLFKTGLVESIIALF